LVPEFRGMRARNYSLPEQIYSYENARGRLVGHSEAIDATTRQEIASSGENPNYTQNQCRPSQ
jgi:hypothetical protein